MSDVKPGILEMIQEEQRVSSNVFLPLQVWVKPWKNIFLEQGAAAAAAVKIVKSLTDIDTRGSFILKVGKAAQFKTCWRNALLCMQK